MNATFSNATMMIRLYKSTSLLPRRSFKNFGHKREPIPMVTTLWHGFLTFTFIGLGLNWDVISNFIFDGNNYDEGMQNSVTNVDQNN